MKVSKAVVSYLLRRAEYELGSEFREPEEWREDEITSEGLELHFGFHFGSNSSDWCSTPVQVRPSREGENLLEYKQKIVGKIAEAIAELNRHIDTHLSTYPHEQKDNE